MAGEEGGLLDLSPVFPYRRYLAVQSVEPMRHHFTIRYHDIEPSLVRVRVSRAPSGAVVLVPGTSYWGGLAVAPESVAPVPSDVRLLARDVEARFASACRGAREIKLQYDGEYREVAFVEIIPISRGGVGWHSSLQLAMNEDLSGIVRPPVEGWSGFGSIEVSARAQWLPSSGVPASTLVSAEDLPPALVREVGQAARRFERGLEPKELASFVPKDAPLVPPEYPARVTAVVSLYPRRQLGAASQGVELRAVLSLRDAVFGTGSSNQVEATIGSTRYTLRASLASSRVRTPEPGYRHERFEGTLVVHVEDDAGGVWEGSCPVTGSLDLDGEGVAAPTGLQLPNSSTDEQLFGTLPGRGSYRVVDVRVGFELLHDPRD